MTFRILIIFAVALTISACSSGAKTTAVAKGQNTALEPQTIYLMPVKFSDTMPQSKIMAECSMLDVLERSIMTSASTYRLNVKSLGNDTSFNNDHLRMMIEFVDVTSHRWSFMTFRPSSTATFRISIYKNGELLDRATKSLASGVSFGACGRLEKISLSAGSYVNRWVSTQI
ncbi:MAG: hypothetical protein KUG72_06505 [Pseudomonadales bacterium]|nr:hypothetical protein [Pseudomonadales bacterium]